MILVGFCTLEGHFVIAFSVSRWDLDESQARHHCAEQSQASYLFQCFDLIPWIPWAWVGRFDGWYGRGFLGMPTPCCPHTSQPWRNYFALSMGPRLRDFEDSGLCREFFGEELFFWSTMPFCKKRVFCWANHFVRANFLQNELGANHFITQFWVHFRQCKKGYWNLGHVQEPGVHRCLLGNHTKPGTQPIL